jgi:O-antigen/teichoic acid export membrane protein
LNILRVARRAGWGLADQALSSLTNFAVGVIVARSVSPEDFGAFGLVFATYLVVLGVSRAIASEPLLVRFSAEPFDVWRSGAISSTGTATAIGAVAGVLSISVGLIVDGSLGHGLVALGVTLPGLLLQDSWRLAFFADGRGAVAFVNDLVWALLLAPMLAIAASKSGDMEWFMLAWGTSASGAALFGFLQARFRPRVSAAVTWWNEHRDLAPKFLSEFVVRAGGSQLVFFGLGAVAGLSAVGSIRGAQIVLGPFHVIFQGIWLIAIPEQKKLLKRAPSKLRTASLTFSGFLAAAATAYGIALLFLPDWMGRGLVGATWSGTESIVFPLALSFAGLGGVMGAASGLRALAAAKRSLQARTTVSVMIVCGGMLGAWVGQTLGAAIGLAVAYWLGAVVWWWHFNEALSEFLESSREDAEPGPVLATMGKVDGL